MYISGIIYFEGPGEDLAKRFNQPARRLLGGLGKTPQPCCARLQPRVGRLAKARLQVAQVR